MKPKIKYPWQAKKGLAHAARDIKLANPLMKTAKEGICAFPYSGILRYGGIPPKAQNGEAHFWCPGSDVRNIFKWEVVEEDMK